MENVNNTQIIMTDRVTVRSGEDVAFVAFQILPKEDRQSFWIKNSTYITVGIKETDINENLRILTVKGNNYTNQPVKGYISVTLDDGTISECEVEVLPELASPPRFTDTPEIIFENGKAIVKYDFEDKGDNIDESDISWYRVDKLDRSKFLQMNFTKQSNETDCRKLAVSRSNNPCKEIRLTTADIGKHLKVNIKPKHSNSYKGQGLNIISPIVKQTDVDSSIIILNTETVVDDNTYLLENGYFTIRGNLVCEETFGISNRKGLVTESMGCGILYCYEGQVGDMSLDVIIDPECKSGNGFEGTHQYEDIYIKYDPISQNGYGLRIAGTLADDGNVAFSLYQFKNGNEIQISEEFLSKAFRTDCQLTLEVKKDSLSAFISYDDGEDFSDLDIRTKITENTYGGFGFKHMAEVTEGYRTCLKYMEARYKYSSCK